MGLDSLLGGTAQDVTIEKMSTSDNWDYILYNNLWSISKSGSYYTVKNGRISDMSYMTAPSNTINGFWSPTQAKSLTGWDGFPLHRP